jgi:hypothetical protein
VVGARLLGDAATRRAALAIASSGGLLVGDLPKQLQEQDRDRSDQIMEEMKSTGLIASEMVVICNRNSSQVARVPSADAINEMADRGLRCACGRDIREERAEEALALTDLGRTLITGSRWMTILLMDELIRIGIEPEHILIEQTAGGDEMDCFADISGELCLFELKDKEFNLGNAYSFGAKIGIYRPEYPVVVTSAYVGTDAKDHFDRAQMTERAERQPGRRGAQRPIHYIEGIDQLRTGMASLAERIYRKDAAHVLRSALPLASVDPGSLLASLARAAAPAPAPAADGAAAAE